MKSTIARLEASKFVHLFTDSLGRAIMIRTVKCAKRVAGRVVYYFRRFTAVVAANGFVVKAG